MTAWLHPDAILRHKIKVGTPPTCRACRNYVTGHLTIAPDNCRVDWRSHRHAAYPEGFPSCLAFNDKPETPDAG